MQYDMGTETFRRALSGWRTDWERGDGLLRRLGFDPYVC